MKSQRRHNGARRLGGSCGKLLYLFSLPVPGLDEELRCIKRLVSSSLVLILVLVLVLVMEVPEQEVSRSVQNCQHAKLQLVH